MSLDHAPAPRPRMDRPRQVPPPVKPAGGSAPSPVAAAIIRESQKSTLRVAEDARPWFYMAPAVFMGCAKVIFFPIHALIKVAELLMSFVVLGILGVAVGWYLGKISDQQIMLAIKPIGDRLLAMVQGAGLL